MCDPRHGRVTERRWSLKLVAEEEEEEEEEEEVVEEEEHWLQCQQKLPMQQPRPFLELSFGV